MISFCKSCLHSLLGFPCSNDRRHPTHLRRHIFPPPDRGGLHLLAGDSPKMPHVVQSFSAVGPATDGGKQADPGAWGLREAAPCGWIGRCTEGLGSESCDGGIDIDDGNETAVKIGRKQTTRRPSRKSAELRFPPPLPWLSGPGGRRCRFLKADRRDGRFVLTEIRIDPRPEMLRAIRTEGRLRLQFIGSESQESPETLENESEISLEEAPEENEERWKLPPARIEGQRCVDTVSGDGSSPLWWSHRFVTMA